MSARSISGLVVACLVLMAGSAFAQESPDSEPERAPVTPSPETLEPRVDTSDATAAVVRRRSANGVMDELDLDSTRVTGNQELPKVLYIVPWKQADLGDIVGRPVNTLLDEALEPVDRNVFRRQLAYYDDIYGDDSAADVEGE